MLQSLLVALENVLACHPIHVRLISLLSLYVKCTEIKGMAQDHV